MASSLVSFLVSSPFLTQQVDAKVDHLASAVDKMDKTRPASDE